MRYTGLIACAALFSSTLAKPGYQGSYDSSSYGSNSGSDNSPSYNYGSSSYGDNSGSDKSPSYSKGYDSQWNGGLKWDKTKSSWSKATQTIIGQNSTVTQTQTEAFTATEAVTATEVSVEAVTSTAVSTMLVTQTEDGVASTLIIIVNISDGLPAATSIAAAAAATTTAVESYTTEAALSSTTFSVVTQATAFAPPANTSIALQLNATAPPSPAVFTGSGGKISVDYALTAAGAFALAAFLGFWTLAMSLNDQKQGFGRLVKLFYDNK